MATTVGHCKLFVSDEIIMVQDDIKDVGKRVQTLVMLFDQVAYEAYLSGPRSP